MLHFLNICSRWPDQGRCTRRSPGRHVYARGYEPIDSTNMPRSMYRPGTSDDVPAAGSGRPLRPQIDPGEHHCGQSRRAGSFNNRLFNLEQHHRSPARCPLRTPARRALTSSRTILSVGAGLFTAILLPAFALAEGMSTPERRVHRRESARSARRRCQIVGSVVLRPLDPG